jgi:SOS-response transcriptional repressor LexA
MADTVLIGTTNTLRIAPMQYAAYRKNVQRGHMTDEDKAAALIKAKAGRLREAREKAGYKTAVEAANAMRIGVAGYRHHDNGTRAFDYEAAKRYASQFKTTAEWLMDGKIRDEPDPGPRQSRLVTLLSWVGAGRLGPVAPIESVENAGTFTVERLAPGEYVALSVEGGSMDRIAVEGSTIIVNRRDRRLVNRRFYVFVAADGETTFKRYRSEPDRYAPYSTNPDEEPIYPEIEADRGWQVFGRVVRVITDI